MGRLINIDNGGTLTDIVVIDGEQIHRTKTLTTPHDLSRCFVEGLREASRLVYGDVDLQALLKTTESIRYSTTQGTNAIVQKQGPRVGVILSGTLDVAALTVADAEKELWEAFVGDRVVTLASASETDTVAAINALTSQGASRIVVACGGDDVTEIEVAVRSIAANKFPKHLLGAVPLLFSHEVADDANDVRRTWTAVINAFLHPAMERFLYNAEHQLRINKNQNPLLIFRNDGLSARVAKTTAIKTYSSGPRGGIEGINAAAAHLGFDHVVSLDVGGTTTDFAELRDGRTPENRYGRIHGIETSFPLSESESVGIGGSSVIRAEDGVIKVGPESVGSAPGPACFGLGGERATVTDAAVVAGLLDPETFFNGNLRLDRDRAAKAIAIQVGDPLGLSETQAAEAIQRAWVDGIADALARFSSITPNTVLAAFGGGGPLLVCNVADAVGLSRVYIPGLAPVFSAYGLGFSDIGHRYFSDVDATVDAVAALLDETLATARRDMFAEGVDLEDSTIVATLLVRRGDAVDEVDLGAGDQSAIDAAAGVLNDADSASLEVNVSRPAPHPALSGAFDAASTAAAVSVGTRSVLRDGTYRDLPLYRLEDQPAGASASGPAVLEDEFFTCRVEPLWTFQINEHGDVLLSRQ